jgi:hypothetical protein
VLYDHDQTISVKFVFVVDLEFGDMDLGMQGSSMRHIHFLFSSFFHLC